MNLYHPILIMLMATGTHQENECRIFNKTISCEGIQQEDFIYQLFKNEDDFQNTFVNTVEIVDSNYSFIEAFPDPERYFGCEIHTLKIRSSSIRRIDKNAFKDLEGLTSLDLGRNCIEDISFIESINSNLRSLNLEDNRIQILDLNIFSAKLYLDTVIMRGNNIGKITASQNQLEITFVDLSFNRISAFNESDLNCFFSSIDLSYNELQNITILDVLQKFYKTETKVVVNLAGNDLASLRAQGKNSFSCEELYLTSVPTEIPDEFIISGIFSLANTKIREWNKDVFNIDVVSKSSSYSLIIDFSNSSITKFSESYFENVEISVLNLSHNDFTVMNKNIFNKSIVTHLDLSFSNISSLPNDSFRGLEMCQILNLTGNHLEIIEDICKYVQFSTIDLSSNRIRKIGENSFENCSQLGVLNISNSMIEYIEPNSFASSNYSLAYLDLSNNNITNLKEDSFVNLTKIEIIDLSSNNLGVLETNTFYNLSVMDIKLWNSSIKYIRNRAFNNLYNLRNLNLSNIGIIFLESYAFFNLPSLKTIDLSKNSFETIESHTFSNIPVNNLLLKGNEINHIKSGAFENLGLNALNLSNLGIQKLEPFSFSGLRYLSAIDLRDNNISEIRENVFSNLTVERIFLENNNISKISAIDNCVNVEELTLNFFGTLESHAISNINLKKLFLANSSIELLKTDCFMGLYNLKELHLNDSDIGSYEPGALNGLFHLEDFDASYIFEKNNTLIRDFFSDLHSLRTLRISNVNLTEIQVGAFSGLAKLNELHLINDSLKGVNLGVFGGLESLNLLNLSHNLISSFDLNDTLNEMNILDLSHNLISSFDLNDTLNTMKNLTSLRLSFNQLYSFNINSSLETLLLDNNNIETVNVDIQGVVKLKTLHFQNNNLRSIPLGMFRNWINLEELRLDGNTLATLNPDVFGDLNSLRILNISENRQLFQQSTNINLINLLNLKSSKLQTIMLDNTYLRDGFDYKSLIAVKNIGLNYNRFSCTGLLTMLKYFDSQYVKYTPDYPRYDIRNVAGIVCDYTG